MRPVPNAPQRDCPTMNAKRKPPGRQPERLETDVREPLPSKDQVPPVFSTNIKLEGIMPASTNLSRPVAGHKTNCCLSDSVQTYRIEVRA